MSRRRKFEWFQFRLYIRFWFAFGYLHSSTSLLGEDYRLMNERFQVPKTAILCRKWLLFSRIDTELADGGGKGGGAAAGDGNAGAGVQNGV